MCGAAVCWLKYTILGVICGPKNSYLGYRQAPGFGSRDPARKKNTHYFVKKVQLDVEIVSSVEYRNQTSKFVMAIVLNWCTRLYSTIDRIGLFLGLKPDIVVTQFPRYDRQKGLDKPV